MKHRRKKSQLVIAHRGFSARYPENTLAAIDAALKLRVDMVEIDVHETSDGQVIVFHDYRLDRLCGCRGQVRDHSLSQIRILRWDIPTLEQVLKRCRGHAGVLLEIKRADPAKVVAIVERCGMTNQTTILTGSVKTLRIIGEIEPKLNRFGLVRNRLKQMIAEFTKLNLDGIAVDKKLIASQKIVRDIRSRGWKLFAWTVNRLVDMEQLNSFGVDGLITNHPDRALYQSRV